MQKIGSGFAWPAEWAAATPIVWVLWAFWFAVVLIIALIVLGVFLVFYPDARKKAWGILDNLRDVG